MELLFSGVPVADFAAATQWYERFFGRPPDVVVHDHEVMWRVSESGWVYVVRDPERAGRALVAISVSDLPAALDQVRGRGIAVPPVELIGDVERKASIADPEGNVVALIKTT